MATNLSITNPKDLPAVHDLIHDCYFDIDGIAFDRSLSVLSFLFRRFVAKDIASNSKMGPAIEGFLRVHHVDNYSVHDTQRLGTNSFNVLTYDPSARCVLVQGNVPMDIRIFVHDFEVSVEVADKAFEPMENPVVQP
jgi:hypothetical protein